MFNVISTVVSKMKDFSLSQAAIDAGLYFKGGNFSETARDKCIVNTEGYT